MSGHLAGWLLVVALRGHHHHHPAPTFTWPTIILPYVQLVPGPVAP